MTCDGLMAMEAGLDEFCVTHRRLDLSDRDLRYRCDRLNNCRRVGTVETTVLLRNRSLNATGQQNCCPLCFKFFFRGPWPRISPVHLSGFEPETFGSVGDVLAVLRSTSSRNVTTC